MQEGQHDVHSGKHTGTPILSEQSSGMTIEKLRTLDQEIVSLEHSGMSPHQRYVRVAELINRLSGVIDEAEQQGMLKSEIFDKISMARQVFGQSPYVRRMQQWPRGYQGDFETVEMIYQGVPGRKLDSVSDCVDYYAQTLPVSQQHRNKLMVQQNLAMSCLRHDQNILSIGCGGAIDIFNALEFFPDYSGSICFVDMDEEAIALARQRTSAFNCSYSTRNIIRGIGAVPHDNFDLILCGGLFDYINDKVSNSLLRQMSRKLTAQGKLFLTNIAIGNPFRIQMEYLGDWVLIERSEAEIENLIKSALGENTRVLCQRDSTGLAILTTSEIIRN